MSSLNEDLQKFEKYMKQDYKKRPIGYLQVKDKVHISYSNGDDAKYPLIPHNIEALNREIIKSINYDYEMTIIIKRTIKKFNAICMAILIFMSMIEQDAYFLTILFSILTLPICYKAHMRADAMFKISARDKFLLENIDLLNEYITEEEINSFAEDEKLGYEYNNKQFTPGNIRTFFESNPILIKKINEVKNGQKNS